MRPAPHPFAAFLPQAVRAVLGALWYADNTEFLPAHVADSELRQLQAVRAVLGALPYADNAVYLHTDAALVPRRRAIWASWNCIQALKPYIHPELSPSSAGGARGAGRAALCGQRGAPAHGRGADAAPARHLGVLDLHPGHEF